MSMHKPKIDLRLAADAAEKTEFEICSPGDPMSPFAAESDAVIVNTMTLRHREILSWWSG